MAKGQGNMDAKQLFVGALQQATNAVKYVSEPNFLSSTPCTDWDCRTLVNHMLYELAWMPDLLEGKTVAEVGNKYDGDLLGKDHHQAWHLAAHKAASAVQKVDLHKTVHLSFADVDAEYYINQVAGDLLLHAWDADQSLNCSLVFTKDMAQTLYDIIEPQQDDFTSSGLFGTPVKVPKTARIQTKLLALVGRREPTIA